MCGIAGAFGNRAAERSRLLSEAIRHRGPDDAGCTALLSAEGDELGAFDHRRLAIIDLSPGGHQPMSIDGGRLTIVFNGEIYNYRELRQELQREGAEFRTGSDTEVILVGWARHGRDFLARLRGMFALALWDARERRGWVARDPFGIKPLYWTEQAGTLLFASEIRALLASGLVPRVLSRAAVASYLATGSVSEPLTIVEDVRMLPAGTVAEVRVERGRATLGAPDAYGPPALRPAVERIDDPAVAARHVRAALRDSVAHHLIADVPVGLFLSGGIDSSAVVALASEVSSGPVSTFTIVFEEQEYSEETQAAAVAKRFRTDHHAIPMRGVDLLASLPAAFAAMDQPSLDGLNTFAVSDAVRRTGLKVVLSGLGGDELFAGYPSFRRADSLGGLWDVTAPVRGALGALAERASGTRTEKFAMLMRGPSPAQGAYRASRALFGERTVQRLTGQLADDGLMPPPPGLTLLQQVSWYETTGYMRNTLLRDSDVFSMAHALELRVPFVDRVVADASFACADALKLRNGASKPLLLSAVEDLLPREVWDRPKRGFTLPFSVWMQGPLAAAIDGELRTDALARVGLETTEARAVWSSFRAGDGMTWSRPWALYTLARWAREHDMSIGPATSRVPVEATRLAG